MGGIEGIKPLILSPHTKISGGTKVLFTLAQELNNHGIETQVGCRKISTLSPTWTGRHPTFKILPFGEAPVYNIPKDITHIISYGDGKNFNPLPGVKNILYLQNFGMHSYDRECINLLYPYDAIAVTSHWLADIAKRFCKDRVYLIPPAIDDIFAPIKLPKSDVFTVGCLYHEAPPKNVDLFLAAANKLTKAHRRLKIVLLASRPPTVDLSEKLVCDYSIIVNPPQALIPAVYRSCNIWCSTSVREGFGLPILEAMACGVPTVVVPSLGLDAYLRNKTNCVIAEPTKDSVFDSINMLAGNANLRGTLIVNGIKLAKEFTWKKTTESFIEVLKAT